MVDISQKGILVFQDKQGKFNREQNTLSNLIQDCDIKVGTQNDKKGDPVYLTVEVSDAGTLDRDTFERKADAPVSCLKTSYNDFSPLGLFNVTRALKSAFKWQTSHGVNKNYYVKDGLDVKTVSEDEYNDINYVA